VELEVRQLDDLLHFHEQTVGKTSCRKAMVVAGIVKSEVSEQMPTLHEIGSALDDIVYCDDKGRCCDRD
jgi:hypothetical protein